SNGLNRASGHGVFCFGFFFRTLWLGHNVGMSFIVIHGKEAGSFHATSVASNTGIIDVILAGYILFEFCALICHGMLRGQKQGHSLEWPCYFLMVFWSVLYNKPGLVTTFALWFMFLINSSRTAREKFWF